MVNEASDNFMTNGNGQTCFPEWLRRPDGLVPSGISSASGSGVLRARGRPAGPSAIHGARRSAHVGMSALARRPFETHSRRSASVGLGQPSTVQGRYHGPADSRSPGAGRSAGRGLRLRRHHHHQGHAAPVPDPDPGAQGPGHDLHPPRPSAGDGPPGRQRPGPGQAADLHGRARAASHHERAEAAASDTAQAVPAAD